MDIQLLILIKGLPGSGKSTLATALARALRCPQIDKDDARDCFTVSTALAPQVDWNELSYKVMFRIASRQLALGLSVVLDCPFSRRQLFDEACEMAARVYPAAKHTSGPQSIGPQQEHITAPAPPATGAPAAREIRVVVVDVECGNEALWRSRLEARGEATRGAEQGHKPGSWQQLQELILRLSEQTSTAQGRRPLLNPSLNLLI